MRRPLLRPFYNHKFYSGGTASEQPGLSSLSLVPYLAPGHWLGRFFWWGFMHDPDDATIRRILTGTRTVAVVGWSANPERPSHGVAGFLVDGGMRVIPVNPGLAGQIWRGETVCADLAAIPLDARVEMVDIFRRSDAVAGIVGQALASLPDLKVIWMQLGVRDDAAAARAAARGIMVVQDRCPKIEARRLGLGLPFVAGGVPG